MAEYVLVTDIERAPRFEENRDYKLIAPDDPRREGRGWKYELLREFRVPLHYFPADPRREAITSPYVDLSADGVLTVRARYPSDGPSGPTVDTDDFLFAAIVVHDPLYELMRRGALAQHWRKAADLELRRFCKAFGMPWWRRLYVYYFVRWFAAWAAKRTRR